MIIHNVGYHHNHDADFFVDRPQGSGDYLLLLLKSDTLMTLDGKEIQIPANSFFLYQKGTPQHYRCMPQHTFLNDWIHFLFEDDEEAQFLSYHIPYNTPIPLKHLHFLSFCIKSIAYENYTNHLNKDKNIACYLALLFSKVEEAMQETKHTIPNTKFEMLSTIRSTIYSKPYEFVNVESAAHAVRMSRSSFQHQYKQQFGVSFMQDLIQSRISYAKMLLISTNLTISEIAVHCGYHSCAHFVRQFKATANATPTEYRIKQNCSEEIAQNV